MSRLRWSVVAVLGIALGTARGDAAPLQASEHAADRGIDLFLHASGTAAAAGSLEVLVDAFGFPNVTSLAPLAGAELEVAWDPESLGDVTSVPAAVRATTDGDGRARVTVPVPAGPERDLSLLVAARFRGHDRVRALPVHRVAPARVVVQVVDRHVVPGSVVSAWALVTDAASGAPVRGAPLEVALTEGGKTRESQRAVSDAAGTALVRVRIPKVDAAAFRWTLRVRAAGDGSSAEGSVELVPREETPGAPKLAASWTQHAYLAGDRAAYAVELRDATDQPMAGAPVRVWVGPKGTHPPKDDAGWERIALRKTDGHGLVEGSIDAPRTVVRGTGSALDVVAKAEVDGRTLDASASATVGVGVVTATIDLEAGSLVPGVTQRALLRILDGRGEPVAGRFHVDGDGLSAEAATGADGEAEVVWSAPVSVGARREVGPCAGGVASGVRVRRVDAPVKETSAGVPAELDLCVPVDRDAEGFLVVDRPVVRVGERVHVTARLRGGAASATPWTLVVAPEGRARALTRWVDGGQFGADFEVPEGAPGRWTVTAAFPSSAGPARVLGRALIVGPRALPKLTGVASGRAAPGGWIDVDATLADERGAPLTGTVAAVLVDSRGGASTARFDAFDTRRSLCLLGGVPRDRCDAFVAGDASSDPLRRAAAGRDAPAPMRPALDPGRTATTEMEKTFGDVVKSLEGGVFEAAVSAERLRDVRRRDAQGWSWNPEILSLASAALPSPPLTPGGEPVTLADLIAIDPQVTFDHVARRVTRLKLFRVLAAVRQWRRDENVDPDEPIFKDPNALLRRLVREGKITQEQLVDPWGGTLEFTRASGPPAPFLSVVHGFELHAPGPDGRVGTGDDVKDPFERVLRSGSSYAKALHEDVVVDAKFDAQVADATVTSWGATLDQFTGTALGLVGVGEGGGGRGEGMGFGGMGTTGYGSGHGRLSGGLSLGGAAWSAPVRTDANGHARLRLQLGDVETVWRVALVAIPDLSTPATTTVDVASFLPASVRVEAGASWVEGDAAEAALVVRNRTAQPKAFELVVRAGGVLQAAGPTRLRATVAALGEARLGVALRALGRGRATLGVDLMEASGVVDHVDHAFEVAPAGELTDLTQTQWVDAEAELVSPLEPGMRLVGAPRLVLERGALPVLGEAIASLDADRLVTPDAMAVALEVASRVRAHAIHVEGQGSSLAARAVALAERADGRLAALRESGAEPGFAAKARAAVFATGKDHPATPCPPDVAVLADRVAMLDVEPPPRAGAALACWDAFVSTTVTRAQTAADPVLVAQAVVAFAERPHRAPTAAALVDRLREIVKLRPSGGVSLPEVAQRSRAARATIFAALARASSLGKSRDVAPAAKLEAWMRVQEDADGGYGSAAATLAVVRALLADPAADAGVSAVRVGYGDAARSFEMGAGGRVVVPLNADATRIAVTVSGAPLVARLERPVLRPWSHPPDDALAGLKLEADWPEAAHAGGGGVLRVGLRHGYERALTIDARVPLPPGASLAAAVEGVRQIQGVLVIRRAVDASLVATTLDVPLRFALSGHFTVPEATARAAFEESPRAVAASRPFVVR